MVIRPQTIIAGLIILFFTVTVLLYGPATTGPFFFDDYNSIMNDQGQVNPRLKNPFTALDELRAHPFRPDRSLAWLTFALSYRYNGLSPTAFRAVNLALHGLTTLVLYLTLCL
ncbi:MAG: hypothetical protein GXO34_00580, partial [Deltaproteobacteria bacterium]|nr:hypothetical protein [Deltaproteobacteria bacterium]